jgi:hypothetical protein
MLGLPECDNSELVPRRDSFSLPRHRNAGFIRQNHHPHAALPDKSGVPMSRRFSGARRDQSSGWSLLGGGGRAFAAPERLRPRRRGEGERHPTECLRLRQQNDPVEPLLVRPYVVERRHCCIGRDDRRA